MITKNAEYLLPSISQNIMLIGAIVIISIWWCYYYTNGMSIYVTNNMIPRMIDGEMKIPEESSVSLHEEWQELKESDSLKELLIESNDVLHSFVVHLIISHTPITMHGSVWIWIPVFYLLPMATLKLGYRQWKHGCIRNHKRINADHECLVNQKL